MRAFWTSCLRRAYNFAWSQRAGMLSGRRVPTWGTQPLRVLYRSGPVVLGASWIVSMKDFLGIEKVRLDEDPIKDKIKQAMLLRKHHRYDEAVKVLHDALGEARGEPVNEAAITYIITELGNTYLEMEDLGKAEALYREAIIRQIQIHGKNEMSTEFIVLSLHMSDVFARKGDLENAEIGYKHCVARQMEAMDIHLKDYLVAKGAKAQSMHPVDMFGHKYADPIALFGMALEDYAHFLLEYYSHKEERVREATEYMDEVLKLSHHLFGGHAAPLMVMLNNFAAKCIIKHKYELARKYLSVGIDRIVQLDECAPLIVNFYLNYAEALFHCGQISEAMDYAIRAEKLARGREPEVKNYAEKFRNSMEKDARRQGYRPSKESGWLLN